MEIKAVIFDLDDTIYDENQFVRSGFRAVSDYMEERYGSGSDRFYQLLLNIFLRKGRMNVFDEALKEMNIYSKDIVLDMVKVYRNHFPDISISQDDLEVLTEIRKKFRIGLVTDGIRKVQENKVKALKVADLFDVITYAIEHGGKNNPQTFLTTLERLGVKPSETIYIDDNPCKGLNTAGRLNIHTVRILRGENKNARIVDEQSKPEFEIENLRQLCDVLRTA